MKTRKKKTETNANVTDAIVDMIPIVVGLMLIQGAMAHLTKSMGSTTPVSQSTANNVVDDQASIRRFFDFETTEV